MFTIYRNCRIGKIGDKFSWKNIFSFETHFTWIFRVFQKGRSKVSLFFSNSAIYILYFLYEILVAECLPFIAIAVFGIFMIHFYWKTSSAMKHIFFYFWTVQKGQSKLQFNVSFTVVQKWRSKVKVLFSNSATYISYFLCEILFAEYLDFIAAVIFVIFSDKVIPKTSPAKKHVFLTFGLSEKDAVK